MTTDERDWLVYLPASAGNPEFIQRACTYLEEMRLRIEAESGPAEWLEDAETYRLLRNKGVKLEVKLGPSLRAAAAVG